MTPDRFEEIVNKRLDHCKKLLLSKGKEYSRDGDRLHNFKTSARIDNTTPSRELWGYAKKHIISVKDIIDDLDKGIFPSQRLLDDKFSDWINYILLLEGIIEDMENQNAIDKETNSKLIPVSDFLFTNGLYPNLTIGNLSEDTKRQINPVYDPHIKYCSETK